ncbi:hypothetical protein AB0368_18305 [Actinoplanes sp. NPDC051475]|uniref:hypothetical protein n=1 Tax=Actinoplanes sp. NPDC051475 TaxID=3157225 RepID=UPI00344BE5E0
MPKFSATGAFVTPTRRLSTCVGLLIVGVLVGGLLTWHLRYPHTVSAERLTGTVSWSNQETRLIAFEEDGKPQDPEGDQTFYNVIADDLNFPSCLVGTSDEPVRQDQRRVEVEAVHQALDGQQRVHFAVSVRCLG